MKPYTLRTHDKRRAPIKTNDIPWERLKKELVFAICVGSLSHAIKRQEEILEKYKKLYGGDNAKNV